MLNFFYKFQGTDLINFLAPIFESATHTYMVKHVCNEVALWNSLWNLPIEDHLKKISLTCEPVYIAPEDC